MRFYCRCLNVTLDVLEIDDQQETTLNHLLPLDLPEEWDEYNLLSEQAVHVAWHSLFQTTPMRDITLNRCLACNQHTHVTAFDSSRILVNRDLLNDTTVTSTYLDPNYSKITKIVLPTTISRSPLTGSQNESLPREYELVQQLYRQSLDDADRDTEEKVLMYQQEQEQLLKTKTQGINKELEIFLSFMRSVPRPSSIAKTSPPLHKSLSYFNDSSMESGFGSDIFDTIGTDVSRQSSTGERTFSERTSHLDDETSDDSLLDNTGWFPSNDTPSVLATSVPQNIAFRPCPVPQETHDGSNDLERIGKSFRELSQSLMCTDGTELFGDLPSPPLNAR